MLKGSNTNKFEYLNIPIEKLITTNHSKDVLSLFSGTEIL